MGIYPYIRGAGIAVSIGSIPFAVSSFVLQVAEPDIYLYAPFRTPLDKNECIEEGIAPHLRNVQ